MLDEPFEAVDPVSASIIKKIIRKFVDNGGSVLFSSHVMETVEQVCDSLAVVAKGSVKAFGTMEALCAGRTHDTLADIAESVGMNRDESMAVLHDPSKYANEVRSDEATAKQLGITGVPFFVIDRKFAISGAQPTEVFINALNQASQ
ncbi:DsbA family protein [Paenibacillus sp. UNC496MF]|uniref:DsbA family protein n=1 Tax=Paenibacillus sp. UNC496MF TaxID=1502753 RepID=UPI000A783767|nr:DsbA family protein [Paenibacillus sp. UNC496MF]